MLQSLPPLQDRQEGRQIMITDTLHESKAGIKIRLVQIIEKYTPNTTLLITMFEKKIVVAPFLIARLGILSQRSTGGYSRLVPVPGILLETVVRRHVETTTEPPHRILCLHSRH